jgi:hypothetical protein
MDSILQLWSSFPKLTRKRVDLIITSSEELGVDAEALAAIDDDSAFSLLEPRIQMALFDAFMRTPGVREAFPRGALAFDVFRRLRLLQAGAAAAGAQHTMRQFLMQALRTCSAEGEQPAPPPASARAARHPLLALAQALGPCPKPACASDAACRSEGVALLVSVGMRCSGSGGGSSGACGGKLGSAAASTSLCVLGPGQDPLLLEIFAEQCSAFVRDDIHALLRRATLAAVAGSEAAQRPQRSAELLAALGRLRTLLEDLLFLLRHTPRGQPLLLPPAQLPPPPALLPFAELLEALDLRCSLDGGATFAPLAEAVAAGAGGAAAPHAPSEASAAAARIPFTLAAPISVLLEALSFAKYCSERLAESAAGSAPAAAAGEWDYKTPQWLAQRASVASTEVCVGGVDTPIFAVRHALASVKLQGTWTSS